MVTFLRRHAVGLVALFVALSGSAFAVTNGTVGGSSVNLRFGPGATGNHHDHVTCQTGETVIGGGAEVVNPGAGNAISASRPTFHAGNGTQGWNAAATGGGVRAIAICAK